MPVAIRVSARGSLKRQQAANDGIEYARQLRDVFNTAFERIGPGHAKAFDLMGGYEIRAWMHELGK